MGNITSNIISDTQKVSNTILNKANNNCYAKCSNIINNQNINVTGGSGNIDIEQSCKGLASCAMSSTFEDEIHSILSAQAQQSNSVQEPLFSLGIDLTTNYSNINQSTTTKIANIINNSCASDSNNIINGQMVVVKDRNGNINIGQSGDARSTCVINNLSKAIVFNSDQAKTTQKNKITQAIVIIIIVIAIVLIVGAVLSFMLRKGGKKEERESEEESETKRLTDELDIAEREQQYRG